MADHTQKIPFFKRMSPTLISGLVMATILVLIAIIAPIFLGEEAVELGTPRQLPSEEHLMGTDQLGRDVLARTLVATRLTLIMSLAATSVAVICGTLVGGLIWLGPRKLREFVLRIIDATVAFPSLILALIIAAILGPGSSSAIIAIGVAGIPAFARLVSNMLAGIVQNDYVTTAKLLGVPGYALFSRHLIPNISGQLLVLATSNFALSLLEISSLSFVGLGVQSPEYDYGLLLSDGLTLIYTQPMQVVAPSFMLIYAGVTVILLGDGLATTLDPGQRRQKLVKRVGVKPTPVKSVEQDALVEVNDLHVYAPNGTELVKGVSFAIKPGEVLGLVGESGSGKSMTAMALAGLLADGVRAEAATIRLDDMDLMKRNPAKRLATEIGLVYQDPGTTFNPAIRMGKQLAEVSRIHLGLGRKAAREQVIDSLDRIKVRDPEMRVRQNPFQWSGGMLQRATIASSMLSDPKLIIADEPTTALDVTVQAEVLRQFRRVNRSQGTAMLFISHDIGVVQELCDTVLVMQNGEIIERTTGQKLAAHEIEHPYTQKLLEASPRMDTEIRTRETAIAEEAEGHTL